jgi:hypothetical protein
MSIKGAPTMKVHYRSANARLVFEIEGATPKALFEKIALLQDVFEAEDKCGQCGSSNIRFRVRSVKTQASQDVRYFELRCMDCWAQFDYGQNQDTVNLFPKRRDEKGNVIGVRGWYKYRPQDSVA